MSSEYKVEQPDSNAEATMIESKSWKSYLRISNRAKFKCFFSTGMILHGLNAFKHFSRVASFESLSNRLVVFKNSETTCDETNGPSASNDSLIGLFPRLDLSQI